MASDFWLIAGLGNPGKKYEDTRHNMGFMAADVLAERWTVNFADHKGLAMLGKSVMNLDGRTVKFFLAKPLTYMNLSGDAVGAIANYYKIPAEDIYIICDDLDLPAGKTRIRKKGSAGGHNGLKSLIAGLHTEEFVRFRIGVGHPKDGHTVIEHVLGRPYGEEIERIEAAKKYTADSVERALETTVDKAMNEFNPKRGR